MTNSLKTWPALLSLLVMWTVGCVGASDDAEGDDASEEGDTEGMELTEEECNASDDDMYWTGSSCVPYAYRHEPAEPVDTDNVMNPSELTVLTDLPPPPKSGFRLVLTPVELEPYEEVEYCHAWDMPDIANKFVYTAEVHSTVGLHHANLYGQGINDETGPQPYPKCHPGAGSFIGGGIGDVLSGTPLGEVDIPEVLFANSTQVIGSEHNAFRDDAAFRISSKEITADVHLFNPTPDPLRVEVVYDFYTMPEELVTTELRAFMYMWTDFKIEAQTKKDLVAECDWFGGEVHAIMPHMHQWGVGYDVKFYDDQATMLANPYSEAGFNLPESDIRVFDDPVDVRDATKVVFTCQYDNDLDHPMCHGIGENEMCFLFGYVSAEAQGFGIVPTEGAPCVASHRESTESFDLEEYLASVPPEVQSRLIDLFLGGAAGQGSTCPEESPANPPGDPWDD